MCTYFPCASAGKESACSVGDLGSIPGLGRAPGEGKGYPRQYSHLENSMDCIVRGVTKSWTQPSNSLSLSLVHAQIHNYSHTHMYTHTHTLYNHLLMWTSFYTIYSRMHTYPGAHIPSCHTKLGKCKFVLMDVCRYTHTHVYTHVHTHTHYRHH